MITREELRIELQRALVIGDIEQIKKLIELGLDPNVYCINIHSFLPTELPCNELKRLGFAIG